MFSKLFGKKLTPDSVVLPQPVQYPNPDDYSTDLPNLLNFIQIMGSIFLKTLDVDLYKKQFRDLLLKTQEYETLKKHRQILLFNDETSMDIYYLINSIQNVANHYFIMHIIIYGEMRNKFPEEFNKNEDINREYIINLIDNLKPGKPTGFGKDHDTPEVVLENVKRVLKELFNLMNPNNPSKVVYIDLTYLIPLLLIILRYEEDILYTFNKITLANTFPSSGEKTVPPEYAFYFRLIAHHIKLLRDTILYGRPYEVLGSFGLNKSYFSFSLINNSINPHNKKNNSQSKLKLKESPAGGYRKISHTKKNKNSHKSKKTRRTKKNGKKSNTY
jgi:hypothetical protein